MSPINDRACGSERRRGSCDLARGCRIERLLRRSIPGAVLLLAYEDEIPILSAPGCFCSTKLNVIDLLNPSMLARHRLPGWAVAGLGHGELLNGQALPMRRTAQSGNALMVYTFRKERRSDDSYLSCLERGCFLAKFAKRTGQELPRSYSYRRSRKRRDCLYQTPRVREKEDFEQGGIVLNSTLRLCPKRRHSNER